MRASSVLPLVLALAACGVGTKDGIFDPSVGGQEAGSGSVTDEPTEGEPTSGEPTSGEPTGADASEGSTSGDGGTEQTGDAGSTGIEGEGTCPEAVGPGVYTCPDGTTFSSGDGWARCMVEGVALPAAASLSAYCLYLEDGYFGFSWDLAQDAAYACPPEARYAPSGTVGYCLWEDFALPSPSAEADCDGLVATGTFGFRWPCPA